MYKELMETFQAINTDEGIWIVIFKAEGKTFAQEMMSMNSRCSQSQILPVRMRTRF